MNTTKLRIVDAADAPSLQPDSGTFLGRVREVISVIRAGRTAGANQTPKLSGENIKKDQDT